MLHLSVVSAQQRAEAVLQVKFSNSGGFYANEVVIQLSTQPGARIYYSLDGSKPSEQSNLYKSPISIKQTTVVRAMASNGKNLFSAEHSNIFDQ